MGLIDGIMALLFGAGRNVVRETAEVFRENAEAGAARGAEARQQALAQFGAEFAQPAQGGFDRFVDGLNRLPRPALAFGTLGLFVAAMVDPLWFAERMQGIALVPEPLWWLLGVIVSFYFGARYQAKTQDLQRDLARSLTQAHQVKTNIEMLRDLRADSPGSADPGTDAALAQQLEGTDPNPALEEWRRRQKA
ncbi:holin family protein [Ruegeria sp. 2012CJ41-6]|uniref:Holin family protein n=1 Tax=Ruegeria spongiae TaxID=2942209 RepID=A0ABT0Q353_9RHOB|nr:holin family protein [Ruegeria spongiae]MCL6284306.1 holin family protein [Ruegeria spongiae]